MDLFNYLRNPNTNLLPYEGVVLYYGPVINNEIANKYYQSLLAKIDWRHDEAVIRGKHIITKRKVAWYGDKPFSYTYSNTTKRALPWTKELLELKNIVEEEAKENFNSCLLNLYHNGDEGMAWHSDAERDLKKDGAIGSLSFGAERRFLFKNRKSKEKIEIVLEHGSLLVMKGTTQTNWLHHLPPTKLIKSPRINLTFRSIVSN